MFLSLARFKSIQTGFVSLSILLCVLTACGEAPVYKADPYLSKQKFSSQDVAAVTGSVCLHNGGAQYDILPQSKVSWNVQRYRVATGEAIPFTGSNSLSGGVGMMDGEIGKAKGIFNALIASTDTGDSLRDDRIVGYLFGADPSSLVQFQMTGFKDASLSMNDGDELKGTVMGKLSVAGHSTPLEVAVTIHRGNGVMNITTTEPAKLNVRKISESVNALDLSGSIAHLLTLVNGIEIKDEIELSLDLSLGNVCSTL